MPGTVLHTRYKKTDQLLVLPELLRPGSHWRMGWFAQGFLRGAARALRGGLSEQEQGVGQGVGLGSASPECALPEGLPPLSTTSHQGRVIEIPGPSQACWPSPPWLCTGPATLSPPPPFFLGSASLSSAPPEWQPGEPFLLRHRWHPGGLPPQPAHCAALRPHQLRPGGDPRGQVSARVPRCPSPAAHEASMHTCPLWNMGGASLPFTHLSGSPDPKETLLPPKNSPPTPCKVLWGLGGVQSGSDRLQPPLPQDRGRSAGRLPVLGAAHHHGRGHLGHGADQGGYRQCELGVGGMPSHFFREIPGRRLRGQ